MNVLRAANETHARHAEAVGIERFLRRGDERRMIGQPEIIVRAHVEHALAAAISIFASCGLVMMRSVL